MMLRTIVAIAGIFVLCCDADKNLEDGDLKVNIKGQSGKITFSRSKAVCFQVYLLIHCSGMCLYVY